MSSTSVTASMFVGLLFVLQGADTGCAYYSPQLGRFLSRDPIGQRADTSIQPQNKTRRSGHPGLISGQVVVRDLISGGNDYVDGPNVYCAYFVPRGVDPSGESWLSDCACRLIYSGIAHGTATTFAENGLPTHENSKGYNAMLHCTIACEIHNSVPKCDDEWSDRESEGGLSEQMDLANNEVGQSIGGGSCWERCYEKWKDGDLKCIIDGELAACPAPPDDFPETKPPFKDPTEGWGGTWGSP